MRDKINYQIYLYYINKITNYEKIIIPLPLINFKKHPNNVEDNHSPLYSSLSLCLSLQTSKQSINVIENFLLKKKMLLKI